MALSPTRRSDRSVVSFMPSGLVHGIFKIPSTPLPLLYSISWQWQDNDAAIMASPGSYCSQHCPRSSTMDSTEPWILNCWKRLPGERKEELVYPFYAGRSQSYKGETGRLIRLVQTIIRTCRCNEFHSHLLLDVSLNVVIQMKVFRNWSASSLSSSTVG